MTATWYCKSSSLYKRDADAPYPQIKQQKDRPDTVQAGLLIW
ncbi:hypothetical protein SAMN05192529_10135 [Arachidicoccus rhizosphaerae]|uniref:Uncharacterized protein n=1 Tax=Arachidicoccus rhizosphaerae TaxID=551991 RepID=A0A1H3VF05_9BACT|nr:hypothetical protein SAMN05192529_10135 [Arachidicoccus rhizosphaerae]